MPTPRYWFDAEANAGEIFVFGGMGGTSAPPSLQDVVEILDPMI